jgi:hypothetical protein
MLTNIFRWSTLAALIWLAGTGWAFMLYGLAFVATPTLIGAILCTVAGSLFVTLIHEMGHAVAALACGWRITVFSVRPIGLHMPSRTLAWLPRGHDNDAGGYVAAVPGRLDHGTPERWISILAAGSTACLLLAAIALLLRETWLRGVDTRGLIASNFSLALAIQACVSAFGSLVPHGRSDGAQLLTAARRDSQWLLHRPCAWMLTLLEYNTRLRDLPEWLLAAHRAVPHPGPEGDRHADGIDIGRALDSNPPDYGRARALIDAYRERYGASAWLDSCDAYLVAIGEGDAEKAAARLWRGTPDPHAQAMQAAAKAAVFALQGDETGMKAELRAMRRAVRARSPYRNATFRDIERAIRSALRSP